MLVFAVIFTTIAGMIIGLPTLRLRGDYIAIVTLAFGEIIGRIAVNGDEIKLSSVPLLGGPLENAFGKDQTFTAGRQGITPVDKIDIPFVGPVHVAEPEAVVLGRARPRRGRAVRELPPARLAARPRVDRAARGRGRGRLDGRAVGARRSCSPTAPAPRSAASPGAYLGSYLNTVNADQFQFYFSILVLGMVILGGLGSIWGVVLGAIVLSFINNYFIPDVFNDLPAKVGLDFDMTQITFAIYGFLLVIMMILRPQGLLPERRRAEEMTHGDEVSEDSLYTARA